MIDCRRKESSGTKEQILSFLLNQSLTQSSDPCTAFAATEGLCVLAQTDALQTCSEKEKSRIKKSIEPLEKQTNEVLNKFYDCWRRCNLVFNAQEPICKEPKFSTLEVYRNAQKSGQSSASKSWILCINSCNQGEAEETKGLGAIFKGWAY
ncbi:MAG: hypothetical protein N3A69_10420 [Leptospiraceae bacterium]|nr:hypothetical protein [Leptospiraceae bacterium]